MSSNRTALPRSLNGVNSPRESLDRFRSAISSPVNLTIPRWGRYRPALFRGTAHFDSVRAEVLAIAADSGIPVIDIHEEFVKHGNPRSLYPGHFNEEGYKVVADAVIRALRDAE